MFKNNFVKVLIVLLIAGGMSAFVDYRGQQQIEAYEKSTQRQVKNLENTVTTLQSEIKNAVSFEVLNQSIDSFHTGVINPLESQVESSAAFARTFSKELEGLHTTDTLIQKKNKSMQTALSFLTAEVSSLLNEVRIANKKLVEHSEVLHKHWTNSKGPVLESVQTTKPVAPEPVAPKPLVVSAPKKEIVESEPEISDVVSEIFGDPAVSKAECSYVLEKGSKPSTRAIQRAVNRLTKKASYSVSALFNIVDGKASDLRVYSNPKAPDVLDKTIHKHVSKLDFVSTDEIMYGCNMKFNLQVT